MASKAGNTRPTKLAGAKRGQSAGAVERRRKAFIEAYLSNGGNVTQAALAAGFAEKSAASQGSRLLKNAKVQQELDSRTADIAQKLELNTENVLRSLAQAVFFDPRKLYAENGDLKPITELDDDTAQALAGFDIYEEFGASNVSETLEPQAHGGALKRSPRHLIGFTKKVKWLDKNAARDQAAKILGLYKRDNEQPGAALAQAVHGLTVKLDFEAVRKKMAVRA